jgi:putative ABC transport system substrate-binding protein
MSSRRKFMTLLAGAAAWPDAALAQQGAVPVIGFVYPGTPELSSGVVAAFRKGLGEAGFVEGRNVAVEFRFAYNDNTRVAELLADLVGRRVAVIVTPGSTSTALAAKAATMSIPVVFSVGTDPVEVGLVTSLSRPGGNVTGITSLNSELAAKRLGLMLELLPSAARFATLVNPNNRNTEALTRDAQAAASAIGRQGSMPPLSAWCKSAPMHLLSAPIHCSTPVVCNWSRLRPINGCPRSTPSVRMSRSVAS